MSDDCWTIGLDYAARSWPRPFAKDVEIELSKDGVLTVEATIGSGHMRESTSASIPVRVITSLLQNAGYVVTPPQSGTSDGEKR